MLNSLPAVLNPEQLLMLQEEAEAITCSPALLEYILNLVRYTRETRRFREGLSPRAGLALRNASRAWALLEGRTMVLPEDVQAVVPAVVSHRLQLDDEQASASDNLAEELLQAVPIP